MIKLIIEGGIEYEVHILNSGIQYWFLNHKLHREKGPAAVYPLGKQDWFYQDKYIEVKSQEEFEKWLKLRAFE